MKIDFSLAPGLTPDLAPGLTPSMAPSTPVGGDLDQELFTLCLNVEKTFQFCPQMQKLKIRAEGRMRVVLGRAFSILKTA